MRTSADTWKPEVCAHEELAAATQLLDLPDERALVRRVLDGARTCLDDGISARAYNVRRSAVVGGEYSRTLTLNLGVSASSGTGTYISTLFAVLRRLNWALTFTMYSTREPLWCST